MHNKGKNFRSKFIVVCLHSRNFIASVIFNISPFKVVVVDVEIPLVKPMKEDSTRSISRDTCTTLDYIRVKFFDGIVDDVIPLHRNPEELWALSDVEEASIFSMKEKI